MPVILLSVPFHVSDNSNAPVIANDNAAPLSRIGTPTPLLVKTLSSRKRDSLVQEDEGRV
jgi:hypothetical protein